MADDFVIPIGFGIKATLTLGPDALAYKQGARTRRFALAELAAFAVKRRRRSLGLVASELILRVGERRVRLAFDPDSAEGKRALAALAARLPQADATGLPWEQAAARVGVKAHDLRDRVLEPRIGFALAVAAGAAMAGVNMPSGYGREERLGYGAVIVIAWIVAVYLFVTGWRKSGRPPG